MKYNSFIGRILTACLALAMAVACMLPACAESTLPGNIDLSTSITQNSDGWSYTVNCTASIVMPDELAEAAAVNINDPRIFDLRFDCTLNSMLISQLSSGELSDAFTFNGGELFELESKQKTLAGIVLTYKLTTTGAERLRHMSAANIKASLQQKLTISAIKTVPEKNLDNIRSAAQITTTATVNIRNLDGTKIPIYHVSRLLAAEGSATMLNPRFAPAVIEVTEPEEEPTVYTPAPLADPEVTGVTETLNADDHFAYMQGYPDGSFHPDSSIVRSEVAAIFARLLRNSDTNFVADYDDVSENAWYAGYVNVLTELGVMKGTGDSFEPNRPITRAEFAAVCARFAVASATGAEFTDVTPDHWAYEYIMTAASYGWIQGKGDGTFEPDRYITRTEAAKIVNYMLYRLGDRRAINAGYSANFSDVTKAFWGYYDIAEATYTHEHIVDKTNVEETWLENGKPVVPQTE